MDLVITSSEGLQGKIRVPGDKSISHRSVMIGALAQGKTKITNFNLAKDTLSTFVCLRTLGVKIEQPEPEKQHHLVVYGKGLKGLREPEDVLSVGNSGTTLRILPGILAGQEFFSVLSGDYSVRKRPMDRVIKPLCLMGAKIWGRRENTLAPIAILGNSLRGITYTTPVASAQIKSSLLLAGLLAGGKTAIQEKSKSRDHTERMLRYLGANIEVNGNRCVVEGGVPFSGGEINIPGDLSAAAFLMVGALITSQSELVLENVGINPTRGGLLRVLEKMGADIKILDRHKESNEPRADLHLKSTQLQSVVIEGDIIPQVIDEIPVLAVAATQAEGRTIVKGARELRVKETDRIAAICSELGKLGAEISEEEDGFTIQGPTKLKGCRVSSFGDHRMAMALAIAGLVAEGTTIVEGAECIGVSYPEFEEILKSITK